jgi:hypothetical protein
VKILLWIWQLPQHVLALALFATLKAAGRVSTVDRHYNDIQGLYVIWVSFPGWGVSLGKYIFLDAGYGTQTVQHEHGHSVQSLFLGPLYLLAVGIPSAVFNNLWDRLFHKKWPPEKRVKWYYNRYPEKWADRLGGVERTREE